MLAGAKATPALLLQACYSWCELLAGSKCQRECRVLDKNTGSFLPTERDANISGKAIAALRHAHEALYVSSLRCSNDSQWSRLTPAILLVPVPVLAPDVIGPQSTTACAHAAPICAAESFLEYQVRAHNPHVLEDT